MHFGENPNKCDQCNYSSLQAGNLRSHMKIHGGEKANKCDQCNYATTRAGHLRSRMMRHGGETPYKCDQCNYIFKLRSRLSEKPYEDAQRRET